MLKVPVHLDEPPTGRIQIESFDGGFLSVVACESHGSQARVSRSERAKKLGRPVDRPVVDEEELERDAEGFHRRHDARRECLDVALLVEDGDDDTVGNIGGKSARAQACGR
jgi:hypothetical protein